MTMRTCIPVFFLLFFNMNLHANEKNDSISTGSSGFLSIHSKNSIVNTLDTTVNVKTVIPSGIIYGIFRKEDGPFLIKGNVIVPFDQTLEFGPGCEILIGGEYTSITVFGQLIAKGTSDEPVAIKSARLNPKPWDWDRIYCRSMNRSVFDHCIISNSNHGIDVENGSTSIINCTFEHNSINGVVVKNSEVSISKCIFSNGHIVAVLLKKGAQVTAESLSIKENVTAIACDNETSLRITGGIISGNSNGIVVNNRSSVSMIAVEISKNKNGVVSNREIHRASREMVYGNLFNVKLLTEKEITALMKEPEPVPNIELPGTNSLAAVKKDFSPGFSAMNINKEASSSFIGNVTTGFAYFQPQSHKHPVSDSLIKQTHYPDGIQPELQLFTSGRRGMADVNLLMDLYGNRWLSDQGYIGKNMFNLSVNYAQQMLVLGDFFENSSETSISGRQMTGLKYTGNFLEMGNSQKRIEFKLAAGESEIPEDSGSHKLNIYNTTVDTGMSVRQQITYLASATVKPTRSSSFSAKGIISRDQTEKPLFRNPITDPAAPDPIEAQTGCLEGSINMLGGKMELFTELDLGSHDTINNDEMHNIAWYNPKVEKAAPAVFRLLNKDKFTDHYAFTAGEKGIFDSYNLNLTYMRIAQNYFSAGNPYLENDRRIASIDAEKQYNEKFFASADFSYERTSITLNPIDRNTLDFKGEYKIGENKPCFTLNYTSRLETTENSERDNSEDTSYNSSYQNRQLDNLIGIEGKQTLSNGIGYSLRYQLLWENDISKHAVVALDNEGDGFQNTINGSFFFKIKKTARNKFAFRLALKDENRDSLQGYFYKLSDQLNLNVIPHKLSCGLSGEYSMKKEHEYNDDPIFESLGWQSPVFTKFYACEIEIKYSVTARISIAARGRYEKSYDEAEGSAENYECPIGGLHLTYLF